MVVCNLVSKQLPDEVKSTDSIKKKGLSCAGDMSVNENHIINFICGILYVFQCQYNCF